MGRGAAGREEQGREEGGNVEGENVEREMERGAKGLGCGNLAMGKEVGMGRGEEGTRGSEISQRDMMGCLGRHRL